MDKASPHVFDASSWLIVNNNRFVSNGFVLRDSNSEVVRADVDRFVGNVGVECAETLAILCWLLFANESTVQSLLIENDEKHLKLKYHIKNSAE